MVLFNKHPWFPISSPLTSRKVFELFCWLVLFPARPSDPDDNYHATLEATTSSSGNDNVVNKSGRCNFNMNLGSRPQTLPDDRPPFIDEFHFLHVASVAWIINNWFQSTRKNNFIKDKSIIVQYNSSHETRSASNCPFFLNKKVGIGKTPCRLIRKRCQYS